MKCLRCLGRGCPLCKGTGKYIPAISLQKMSPLYTCYSGNNATLISQVARLYLQPGMRIADVTWGVGAFWHKVDLSLYKFYPTDLKDGIDFRSLPYPNNTFDVVVLDPPYMHHISSDRVFVNASYNNFATTPNMSQDEIHQLYYDGIVEAMRVIRKSGRIWVKCQDSLESEQRYTHIEIFNHATNKLGLYMKDMFILHADSATPIKGIQQHAKKNHSYLLIFENRIRY